MGVRVYVSRGRGECECFAGGLGGRYVDTFALFCRTRHSVEHFCINGREKPQDSQGANFAKCSRLLERLSQNTLARANVRNSGKKMSKCKKYSQILLK